MNDTNTPFTIRATIITKAQLNSIGIDLPDEHMTALIQHIEDTINAQIGEEIVDSLDDQQLAELVALQDNGTPADQIEAWIIQRVPEYQAIIEDNVAIVLGDLAENSEAIQG